MWTQPDLRSIALVFDPGERLARSTSAICNARLILIHLCVVHAASRTTENHRGRGLIAAQPTEAKHRHWRVRARSRSVAASGRLRRQGPAQGRHRLRRWLRRSMWTTCSSPMLGMQGGFLHVLNHHFTNHEGKRFELLAERHPLPRHRGEAPSSTGSSIKIQTASQPIAAASRCTEVRSVNAQLASSSMVSYP